MRVVQINATCGVGSTGKICVGISEMLVANNIENYILYSSKSNGYEHGIKCSNDKYIKIQALKSRIFGNCGFNSERATRRMIAELERIKPDVVHLHNIHGHDCNLQALFSYFKEHKTKLIWTFHDCWAFTAYCPHFTMAKCDKWKTGCENCPQRKEYSLFFDKSRELFQKKKELFTGLDLTIVTPSQWLAELVKASFLKDYPVKVINNGIDLAVFKPQRSEFRSRYNIPADKKLLLGVAFGWGPKKGLDVFVDLAKRLTNDYKIVLVGTNGKVDKQLPENIVSIHRTQNQHELAEIYSAADVFINPTREEVLGLVNIESIACGTPVITFKTGGSPETIDGTCGAVVDCDDIDSLISEVKKLTGEAAISSEACIEAAKKFDKTKLFQSYLNCYGSI